MCPVAVDYSPANALLALVGSSVADVKKMSTGQKEEIIVKITQKKPAAGVVNPIAAKLNIDTVAAGNVAAKIRVIVMAIAEAGQFA